MADQQLNLPLSGPVSQAFSIFPFAGANFGLLNVSMGASSDPDTEREILAEVGSYGRQIGQLTDVITALLRHARGEPETKDDSIAIRLFELQSEMVALVKRRGRVATLKAKANALKQQAAAPVTAADADNVSRPLRPFVPAASSPST